MPTLSAKRIRAREDLGTTLLPHPHLLNRHTLAHNQRTEKEKEFIENYVQSAQLLPQAVVWADPSHTSGSVLAPDSGG